VSVPGRVDRERERKVCPRAVGHAPDDDGVPSGARPRLSSTPHPIRRVDHCSPSNPFTFTLSLTMSGRGKGKTTGDKKKPGKSAGRCSHLARRRFSLAPRRPLVSRSAKAGLQFPVGRIARFLKAGKCVRAGGRGAPLNCVRRPVQPLDGSLHSSSSLLERPDTRAPVARSIAWRALCLGASDLKSVFLAADTRALTGTPPASARARPSTWPRCWSTCARRCWSWRATARDLSRSRSRSVRRSHLLPCAACADNKKARINPRHIQLAIRNDEELSKARPLPRRPLARAYQSSSLAASQLLAGVTIAAGGVLPNIHSVLLPKARHARDAGFPGFDERLTTDFSSTGDGGQEEEEEGGGRRLGVGLPRSEKWSARASDRTHSPSQYVSRPSLATSPAREAQQPARLSDATHRPPRVRRAGPIASPLPRRNSVT